MIVKGFKRIGLEELPEEAVDGFDSIIFRGYVNIVSPEGSDVRIAYELIRQGWRDIFYALLYATGKRLGMRVLTMDREFKRFLRRPVSTFVILILRSRITSGCRWS